MEKIKEFILGDNITDWLLAGLLVAASYYFVIKPFLGGLNL